MGKTTYATGPNKLDPAKIDAWIRDAQPGARLVYFHGWPAVGTIVPKVAEKLWDEEKRGLVLLFNDRRTLDQHGYDYIAERSSRPFNAPLKAPSQVQGRVAAGLGYKS